MFDISKNLYSLINIAIGAGRIIADLRYANIVKKAGNVQLKQDNSPVSIADMQSHHYISEHLTKIYPHIPIISEEDGQETHETHETYFLIDPLDGTRDYLLGSNDYCVNIALINQSRPIFGIIYLPENNECYYAQKEVGSYKIENCHFLDKQEILKIEVDKEITVQTISSRSNTESYKHFNADLKIAETIFAGSAKKFCMIATNIAHIYPKPGQTGEWDTASGDIIVSEAGGVVLDKNGRPLTYGKQNYLNNSFYASRTII